MNDVMTKINGVGDYGEIIDSTLNFESEILKVERLNIKIYNIKHIYVYIYI